MQVSNILFNLQLSVAVMYILEHLERINANRFGMECKNIVMIGRSSLVGTPLSIMMSAKNATVTLCHSYTDQIKNNLNDHCKRADIIVVAAGSPNLIDTKSIKPGMYSCVCSGHVENDGNFSV